jgi:aspartate/methionine/tyrosine aminotransferase
VQLKPHLLENWLTEYEHEIEFDLAASTGPRWTLSELLALGSAEDRQRFFDHGIVYGSPEGTVRLREAIAEMRGVSAESVQIVTGASEALLILMWLAAEPGANVVLPQPGYPPFAALPLSLGLETRTYQLHREHGFRIDVDQILACADTRTKLIIVNTPHNPTGATVADAEMERLHDMTSERGIQLVVDEVYHPMHHGTAPQSAARLPHATVLGSFSKAFPFAGLRAGWIIEPDAARRKRYWTARAYFSISPNAASEILGEIVIRQRGVVLEKTRDVATRNLRRLDQFFSEHREVLDWIRPQGGMIAFPWLSSGSSARRLCEAAAAEGVLLAPGDCFGAPSHFRLGFAATVDGFAEALERLGGLLQRARDVR